MVTIGLLLCVVLVHDVSGPKWHQTMEGESLRIAGKVFQTAGGYLRPNLTSGDFCVAHKRLNSNTLANYIYRYLHLLSYIILLYIIGVIVCASRTEIFRRGNSGNEVLNVKLIQQQR